MSETCPRCGKPWQPVDEPLVMLMGGLIGFFGGALTASLLWWTR